jgi:hypothetical protein
MGMEKQILDKIKRNLDILGISAVRGDSDVQAEGIVISYEEVALDADSSPMRGVDDSSSPYLGIGNGSPGRIKVDLAPAAMNDAGKLRVLGVLCSFANDKELGDGSIIEGHSDLVGMGQ